MNKTQIADIFSDFTSLFFPRYCVGCEDALVKGEDQVCTRCILELPRLNHHLELENPFYKKLRGRIPVSHVMSFFRFTKEGKVQKILHHLKYRNKPTLGVLLGRVYGLELEQAGYQEKFDLIVPVPLHTEKKKRRGYNQSEEFGRGLADSLSIECDGELLLRKYMTDTQTKKSRIRRWHNVKEVFAISSDRNLEGRHVLLVDDVVTTGATLEAAGRVLLDGGCSDLSIACIAATQ